MMPRLQARSPHTQASRTLLPTPGGGGSVADWTEQTAARKSDDAHAPTPPETPPRAAALDRDVLAWRIARLRRYDINLVLSLHALLHTRNVTQAGDWLGVTQPA